MTKQAKSPSKRENSILSSFGAFGLVGAFSLTELLEYPYNFLLVLVPLLVCEGVLVVFFLFKINKKHQTAAVAPQVIMPTPESQPKPLPKPNAIQIAKAEIVGQTVTFSVTKGFLRKRLVPIKEISIADITGVECVGNELSVNSNGEALWFVNQKKGESFSRLQEQITALLEEQQKILEANQKAVQRKSDLTALINASTNVVDLSFNILMDLQRKRVNWELLEGYVNGLGGHLDFLGQTLPPLSLDFSNLSDAVKRGVPQDASDEVFSVLKLIYEYFEGLPLEEDLMGVHPTFKDAQAVVLAYYTLNDVLLGKVVGEKENKKETLALKTVLQGLAKETYFNVNFEELMENANKIGLNVDVESIVEDSRGLFKDQLKNIDRPIEQPSTPESPTEQAPTMQPEPAPSPVPQAAVVPSEPQAPVEPLTQETPAPQQQVVEAPPQPAPVEQPEAVQPPKPIEPMVPAETPSQEPTAKPQTEPSAVVKQQEALESPAEPASIEQPDAKQPPQPKEPVELSQESTVQPPTEPSVPEQQETVQPAVEQPPVQQEEPAETALAEPSLPESETPIEPVEPALKKKSFGRRLRKTIMGY